jgi:hypothetical protein
MRKPPVIRKQVIYGRDGEHSTPYLTRYKIGSRLMVNVFHRGDEDPDPHDHPWDFWTFPLTSYVEEVPLEGPGRHPYITDFVTRAPHTERRIVRAFRLHRRKAEHIHRVLGRHNSAWRGPVVLPRGCIITLVWRGRDRRSDRWGFWVNDREQYPAAIFRRWMFVPWRDYVYGRKT